MKVEIIVRAAESTYSFGYLAEKEMAIESDDPAIFHIGPTAQDMLSDVVTRARAKLDEAEANKDSEE